MLRNLFWIIFSSAVAGFIAAMLGYLGILVAKIFFDYIVDDQAVMYFFWIGFAYNAIRSIIHYDKLF